MRTDSTLPGILIQENNSSGLITLGQSSGAPSSLATAASTFAIGCLLTDTTTGKQYSNTGTVASPSWNSVSEVTYAEKSSIATATATDDGTTTGAITSGSTFVTVTSAGATKQIALPAITSASIGQSIDLYVGANGYELITPASSNNTINTVDSDGTNQLDVAANTLLRCVQVSATGWACYQVAATTITVVAPDND
jgi:hypothetical protein